MRDAKNLIAVFVAAVLILSLAHMSFAADAPLTVRKMQREIIEVTSHVDNITITNIIINKGNLPLIINIPWFPATLKFGEMRRFAHSKSGDPIEVVIETDKGSWTFTWK